MEFKARHGRAISVCKKAYESSAGAVSAWLRAGGSLNRCGAALPRWLPMIREVGRVGHRGPSLDA